METPFKFKQFSIVQEKSAMKLGTDSVLLGAWADVLDARTILDIGTGTGVIAIMAAQRNASAEIHAVEIDPASAEEAKYNAKQTLWSERLHIHLTAIQDFAAQTPLQFDAILSNPPFFTGGAIATKHTRMEARHTTRLPNGELLLATRSLLSPHGKFSVILPLMEGLRFKEMAANYGLYCTKQSNVFSKKNKPIERLLLQFERQTAPIQEDELIIHQDSDEWSVQYKALTKDFYLYI